MTYRNSIIDGFFGAMLFNFNEVKKGEGLPVIPILRPIMRSSWRLLIEFADTEDAWICPIRQVCGDDSYYSISKNEIIVPEKEQYKDVEHFALDVVHNMAHSYVSERNLNLFNGSEYAKEELYAEMVAYAIGYYIGIHKFDHKDDSTPYFKTWAELNEEEYKEIVYNARNTTYAILKAVLD